MNFPSVLERLTHWAQASPSKSLFSFLDDKGKLIDMYTFSEIERTTSSLAIYLLDGCSLNPGDRVMLVFFPGLQFTISLLACFKAGLIAVPVFPPDPTKLKKDLHHFVSIQSSSGSTVALTHSTYNFVKKVSALTNMFSSEGKLWPDLKWIQVDDIIVRSKSKSSLPPTVPHSPQYNDVAFLQYTSGSTSDPKGVMISHANLAHNLTLITRELKADESTVNVSWLPQYHDMGLIGSYLGVVYCGGSGFYLSPISFLKDPTVWIRALSQFKGTHTQAPNFAFALVVRKLKEAYPNLASHPSLSLDLSSLRHMINAAEPIDVLPLLRFYDTLCPFGLPRNVIFPTYGLAEHSVFVCSGGNQVVALRKTGLELGSVECIFEGHLEDPDIANKLENVGALQSGSDGLQVIVGCGFPLRGENVHLLIVSPDTKRIVDENQVGEIWISSPSKALGYWNLEELSQESFYAQLDDEIQNLKYLRTGDLGFLKNDELFICGRLKDLIIVRGSNHYPQDIERTAEKIAILPSPASPLRPGCSAAFSIGFAHGDTEAVAFIAEVKSSQSSEDFSTLAQLIRETVAHEHGLALTSILFLSPRTIPKTTSGKIARSWCRRAFLSQTLTVEFRWDSNSIDSTTIFQHEEFEDDDRLTVEEIRALSEFEIAGRLERTLSRISSSGSAPFNGKIDQTIPLSSLGFDSLTLVQFHGVLEQRFFCLVPDEFLFSSLCNINELANCVKIGGLSEEQLLHLKSEKKVSNGEPICPWFTCCY